MKSFHAYLQIYFAGLFELRIWLGHEITQLNHEYGHRDKWQKWNGMKSIYNIHIDME